MGDQLRMVTDLLHVSGVTVADIAERSGASMQTVSAELAGHRPISDATLEAIGNYAGADVAAEVKAVADQVGTVPRQATPSGRI